MHKINKKLLMSMTILSLFYTNCTLFKGDKPSAGYSGIIGQITNYRYKTSYDKFKSGYCFIGVYKQITKKYPKNFREPNLINSCSPDSLGRFYFKLIPGIYCISTYSYHTHPKEVYNIKIKQDSINVINISLISDAIPETPLPDNYDYLEVKRIPFDSMQHHFKTYIESIEGR